MSRSYRASLGLFEGSARRSGVAMMGLLRAGGRINRRLWQTSFEHSPVGMCLVGLDGRLTRPNHAFAQMTGFTKAQLRSKTFMDLTHPDDVATDVALYEQTLRGERSGYRLAKRFVRPDGAVIWGELMVTLVRTDRGEPTHFISQVMDMTGQHDDQERLRRAVGVIDDERNLLRAILDTVDVGLQLVDRNGDSQRQNRRHREILAMADPSGVREPHDPGAVVHFYSPDGLNLLDSESLPSIRAIRGEEFDDQRVWIGPDPASRRALSVSARTVRGADGEPTGAALSFSDVTDLEHALRAREIFERSVSHELRTPLTAVLGHLEMLLDEKDLPDQVVSQLRVAERNANRLRLLVSDLLDPAAHGQGSLALFRAPADIVALVQETVAAMAGPARVAGIDLTLVRGRSARAFVDAHRVRQVLDNLLSNAIKYTDDGGRVEVAIDTDPDAVVITVADTGIGMDSEDRERAWEPFYRSEEARRRVAPGVGLGLGITQSIARAHGGRVELVSQPGEGSTFRLVLPLGEDALLDLGP